MWNLLPPPNFRALDPHKPLKVYQRQLPHWRQDGATYFVTFRLGDSLPQSKLDELATIKAAWLREHAKFVDSRGSWEGSLEPSSSDNTQISPSSAFGSREMPEHFSRMARESRPTNDTANTPSTREELAKHLQRYVERWLDQGMGECWLKRPQFAAFLVSAMHHFDDARYELGCYVIMPNHVHALVRPFDGDVHALEDILGSWKKYSAARINHSLGRRGNLWQDESYDRIVRDEEHLWRCVQYIGSNLELARLTREQCRLWIRPSWETLGWRFEQR